MCAKLIIISEKSEGSFYLHHVVSSGLLSIFVLMYRLSRQEMRIIEQTRREGEELQRQEETAGVPQRRCAGVRSMLIFVAIFLILAAVIRLLIGLFSN